MRKIFFIQLFLFSILLFSQNENSYIFESSPSFHNGFKIEVETNSNIIKFHTMNEFFILDSLKDDYKSYPSSNFDNLFLKNNIKLLSNSTFEKTIDANNKSQILKILQKFDNVCKINQRSNRYTDGIYFSLSNSKIKKCKIQFGFQENLKVIIDELLLKIKELFSPNTYVDQYIFNSKFYLNEDSSYNIISKNPLLIKIYQLPNTTCSKFQQQIDGLPIADEIYIDISDLSPYISEDDKNCLIETINKKYKVVKIVQSKLKDLFNKL